VLAASRVVLASQGLPGPRDRLAPRDRQATRVPWAHRDQRVQWGRLAHRAPQVFPAQPAHLARLARAARPAAPVPQDQQVCQAPQERPVLKDQPARPELLAHKDLRAFPAQPAHLARLVRAARPAAPVPRERRAYPARLVHRDQLVLAVCPATPDLQVLQASRARRVTPAPLGQLALLDLPARQAPPALPARPVLAAETCSRSRAIRSHSAQPGQVRPA
jgi:hypothetical protein